MYDFKDNKTTGTVTVTKVWDDDKTNDERTIPDIKISTAKPSKSTLGYTVTFHGNGMKFADGTDDNMVVYNSAGEIVQGEYKMAVGDCVGWCTGKNKGDRVVFLDDGTPQIEMTGDLDLWAKEMTFEIEGYSYSLGENAFRKSIPSTVTEVIFTDEIKPASAEVIDVDADGDGGVVAWTENNGTIMKISTQIKGIKVQAAVNSGSMFNSKSNIKKIDLKMLDTLNVTYMSSMFRSCNSLTSLDLSSFDTQNVTDMSFMFSSCNSLTSLDLSSFDTQKVTDMSSMFCDCSDLTTLDLSSFDTQKVTDMSHMFHDCSDLITLDLSSFDTQNVTDMSLMFYNCSSLTALDLSSFDTQKVTNMYSMFFLCKSLTTITTGPNFKFIGTNYELSGTWQNTAGETFTSGTFPSNVVDTYTKISN